MSKDFALFFTSLALAATLAACVPSPSGESKMSQWVSGEVPFNGTLHYEAR